MAASNSSWLSGVNVVLAMAYGSLVFKIEVLVSGRKHFVEKRYSEFHALHKKFHTEGGPSRISVLERCHVVGSLELKKFIRTPELPSKHVRNWVPKVLEQRRQGLEAYLQVLGKPNLPFTGGYRRPEGRWKAPECYEEEWNQ